MALSAILNYRHLLIFFWFYIKFELAISAFFQYGYLYASFQFYNMATNAVSLI